MLSLALPHSCCVALRISVTREMELCGGTITLCDRICDDFKTSFSGLQRESAVRLIMRHTLRTMGLRSEFVGITVGTACRHAKSFPTDQSVTLLFGSCRAHHRRFAWQRGPATLQGRIFGSTTRCLPGVGRMQPVKIARVTSETFAWKESACWDSALARLYCVDCELRKLATDV